jgi:hypothetical protein
MNCVVCFFDLRALRRGGGGGGESEEDVTEMTSSGSGSQFLLRRGGGEDSEGDGRKRGVLDVRRGGIRECADEDRREAPSWLCHMAYAYTQKEVLGRTHLYCVLVKEAVGGGVRGRRLILLQGVCMRAGEVWLMVHTSTGPWSRS